MSNSLLAHAFVRRVAAFAAAFAILVPSLAAAGTGAPRILNYQGRLMDGSGTLLGGAGTPFCFRFSLYDDATVGAGTKLWPAGSPSTMTATVKSGVFSVGIGDTGAGGDTLDYDFQSNDTVYLNVEVATKVGPTCAPGDGAESFETLSPRNRVDAAGYAINANTLGGFAPSQAASGSAIPVLSSDRLLLGGLNAGVSATNTAALTLQGDSSGNINFFDTSNFLTAAGDLTIAGLFSADRITFVHGTSTSIFTNLLAASAASFGATATSSFDNAGQLRLAGGFDGPLQANAGVVSATSSVGVAYGGTGISTIPTFGQLLLGTAAGGYSLAATSTLGLPTFSNLASYLSLSAWYATTTDALAEGNNKYFTVDRVSAVLAGTTTDQLAEGTNNLYFTTARATTSFVGNLAATTSVSSITTLANLVLPATQLSGFGIPFFQYFSATTTDALTEGSTHRYYSSTLFATDLAATTSVNSIVTLNNLLLPAGQVSGLNAAIDSEANSYIAASTTIPKTYADNTFAGTQTFQNASTTNISATYASSTRAAFGTATTTNLAVTGLSSSLLKVNALGQVGAASAGVDFLAPSALSGYLALSDWYSTTTSDIEEGSNLYFTTARATTSFVGNLAATTSVSSITALPNLSIASSQVTGLFGYLFPGNATTTKLSFDGGLSTTYASSTGISSAYASSTQAFFGSLSVGNLSGILKATAGAISTALVNLATDVTGVLGVANGGTGWANIQAGSIPYGNGAGALATTTAGTAGQVLALLNGVPTWTSTTTFAYPLSYSAGIVNLAFGTTTNNIWSGTNTFNGNVTATNATSTSLFSQWISALNGNIGTLTASTSAVLASTTAQGRLIAGSIVSTSTATSSFAGPLAVGIANPSYQVSILGSTTAATSATGTAVLAVTNDNNTLSSGTNLLRLNLRTAYGSTCVTGTTCPRFIEYFAGVGAGSDTGGRGVGSLRLSTAGTGITQTSGSADFAEFMQLNSAAAAGDIVSLNASGEYQKAVAGQSIVGVVSENPAFVGNANIEGQANAYIVGFAGVVPTTVSAVNGAINAGDLIAAGTTAGVGVKLVSSGYAVGQALQPFSGPGTGTIDVLVLPKFVDAAVALDSYGGGAAGVSGYWNLSTTTGQVTLASSTYALVVDGTATFANASTTNISSSYASSTQGFFGSLSVGNLSGIVKATAGALSTALVNLSSDVIGILGVANGGTGTSTAPAYGQLLIGNALGGFDYVATSSLGINSGVWGSITGSIAAQTDLQNALAAKLNLSDWYSTTTSDIEEGSNLYFTTARATTSFVGNLAATTSVSSITALPNLSIASSQVTGLFAYLFPGNATTTGLGIYASTTIGNGTAAGGLTVAGTATTSDLVTTGSVRFGGLLGGALATNALGQLYTYSTSTWRFASSTLLGDANYFSGANAFAQTITGSVSGNAGTATKLQTARAINGVSFDGTADITVASTSLLSDSNTFTGKNVFANATTTLLTAPTAWITKLANLASAGFVKTAADGTLSVDTNTYLTSAITGIGPVGQSQSGPAITLATSSTAYNGLTASTTITGSGNTLTFANTLSGTLGVAGGGTGASSFSYGLLGSNGGTGALVNFATSSLGLLSTNVAEGSNLYYQDSRVNTYLQSSTTVAKTYAANTFTNTNTFNGQTNLAYASSTGISSAYASSTQGFFGSLSVGNLSGILKATAGAISTALVNLATDVTGVLGVANGGTGWANIQAGSIPYGNGAGALATTTAGTAGQVLALLNGVPTWTSTTTFAYPLSYSAGIVNLAFGTTTNNIWSGTNTFNGQTTLATASSTAVSSLDYVAVGRNATTTIRGEATATSTFAGGVQANAINVTSTTASSTFANGIDLANGCFAVNGTCISAGGGGMGANLVNIQAFTAGGTYTPSPGAASAYVIVTGGGGGGGGADGTDTTNETVAGGGGAGGTSLAFVDLTSVTTVTVTVGTGGSGGLNTGTNGSTGNPSSFGTYAAANGGAGGVGSAVNATGCAAQGGIGAGGVGGTASLGDINYSGGAGNVGACAAEAVQGGTGGASYWGGGGRGAADPNGNLGVAGSAGASYGSGGGGAADEDSTTGAAGGAGAGGIVVVYEYGPFDGVMKVTNGGTGTTTAPSYGQVLVGNATGGYDLVATSSLGISGGGSSAGQAFELANGYLAPTTTQTILANGGLVAQASSTIVGPLTVTSQTNLSYASSTGISSAYASSTQAFFGSLSVGNLSGILKATAGAISTALVNLATDVTGVLGVANGGTGWANIQANTLLTGNGAGAVATTSVGSSLQLSGGTLSLNLGNANIWTGLQTFNQSSTTIVSAYRAYFGGTATTSIDTAGNVVVGGTLTANAGDTFLASTSATRFTVGAATSTNATTTTLYISGGLTGAGLSTCSNGSTDKLLWNSTTGQFSCGTDAGAGSGIANLGAAGQLQNGASQTFATSSDTNIGLTITSAANIHTFTTIWNGILSVARGGTGWGNIQAGTLLTGNGTGAVATTSIGSSLQISGSTLSLNLSNANTWTGLQVFGNASSTLLETVSQWARTIQSTSTNALVLKTALTATAGLTLGSTSTPQMFALDTLNNRATIGTGGSSPTLLVVDSKNTAGDPTGINGATYYNSSDSLWRCYANGWRTCGGQAASSTGAVQVRGYDGGFGGTDNFAWNFLTNGLIIKATSSAQTTDLLTIASSTGSAMFGVSSSGVLELASTTDPAPSPEGMLAIYAKSVAGRMLPKWEGPSGIDTPFQPALFGNNVAMWFPNTGTTVSVAIGTSWTARNSGTGAAQSTPAIASTNLYTSMKRGLFSTGTTATGSSGTQSSQTLVWRGNAAGLGGFFFFARVGVDSTYRSDVQLMTGVSALNAALTGQPSAQNNSILLGKDSGDTTWQIITRDGTTANKYDTGLTIASGQILDFYIYARPNDSKVTVRLVLQTAGASQVIVNNLDLTSNLPVNTTMMYAHHQIRSTTGTATAGYALNRIYVETDI